MLLTTIAIRYSYTAFDGIQRCTFVDNTSSLSHFALRTISTLLNASEWKALRNHPNQLLAHYNTSLLSHPPLRITSTLLNASACTWEEALRNHLDQSLAHYFIKGLSEGFRIGFDRSHALVSTKQSLPSVTEQSESAVSDRAIGGTG